MLCRSETQYSATFGRSLDDTVKLTLAISEDSGGKSSTLSEYNPGPIYSGMLLPEESPTASLTRSPSRFVGVVGLLPRLRSNQLSRQCAS